MATSFRLSDDIGERIDEAIQEVRAKADLPDRAAILEVLMSARRRLKSVNASDYGLADEQHGEQGDDFALSLVLSLLEQVPSGRTAEPANKLFARRTNPLRPQELVGSPAYSPYSDLDPRWLRALGYAISSDPLLFPKRNAGGKPDQPGSGIITMKDKATIAIAGDWGTGNSSSLEIARLIRERNPDYTIHLGDVYYAGTPVEVQSKFIDPWPAGSAGTFALNSNHEMYSGGAGYLGLTLKHSKFAAQGGLSHFLLQNDKWAIFGLDSAYFAGGALYMNGKLDDSQREFLQQLGRPALEAGRQVMILTHHEGMALSGQPCKPLWTQVSDALGTTGLCWWYWGHLHGAAVFEPQRRDYAAGPLEIKGRCVGHGGVPYGPLDRDPDVLLWAEDQQFAGDAEFPNRALNGFVMLNIDGDKLTEEFWSETNVKRYP